MTTINDYDCSNPEQVCIFIDKLIELSVKYPNLDNKYNYDSVMDEAKQIKYMIRQNMTTIKLVIGDAEPLLHPTIKQQIQDDVFQYNTAYSNLLSMTNDHVEDQLIGAIDKLKLSTHKYFHKMNKIIRDITYVVNKFNYMSTNDHILEVIDGIQTCLNYWEHVTDLLHTEAIKLSPI